MASASSAAERLLFVGSYTRDEKSQGVTRLKMDMETGALRVDGLAAASNNPSFLATDPAGRFLYAVNEQPSTVTAWRVEPDTGKLTLLNSRPVADKPGAGPCHLTLDAANQVLIAANYGGGSVSAFPIQEDGSIGERSFFAQHAGSGPNKDRQEGPHAHGTHLSPDERHALVPDLGLDQVLIYRLDASKASLELKGFGSIAPGAGPRHGVFHPSLPLFFCINELDSTITSFKWNAAEGSLAAGPVVSTLPEDFKGDSSTAEIAAHPNGKFIYGSNRGHDSIAVFKIEDPDTGRLSLVQHMPAGGGAPRHFTLDPSGRWLLAASQNSHVIHVFSVDPETGKLSKTGHSVKVERPVCVLFLPEAKKS